MSAESGESLDLVLVVLPGGKLLQTSRIQVLLSLVVSQRTGFPLTGRRDLFEWFVLVDSDVEGCCDQPSLTLISSQTLDQPADS